MTLPPVSLYNNVPEDPKVAMLPLMTWDEFQKMNDEGEYVVIIDGFVYNLTKFVNHHPGGIPVLDLAKGTDATDAFVAYHPNWVFGKLKYYRIARVKDYQFTKGSRLFLELRKTLEEAGLFKLNVWFYIRLTLILLVMWATCVGLVLYGPQMQITYIVSAIICAGMWHQASFFAHDAAHSEVTGDAKTDMIVSIFVANLLGGLSVGWWKNNHNVHHIITNDPERDPDIQHIPFFAISVKFTNNLYSKFYKRILSFDRFSQFFISVQHIWFYTILAFGRFNLYFLSWSYCLRKERTLHRKQEIICMVLFWCWFIPFLSCLPDTSTRILYVFISHTATLILHLQITLSHFAMSTEVPLDASFAERNIRTSMDVECEPWMDWFHGGLQFQVEHHLFPRLPRRNLRKSRPYVVEFCSKMHLDLKGFGFIKSNSVVLSAMQEVAFQVRSLFIVDPKFALQSSVTD